MNSSEAGVQFDPVLVTFDNGLHLDVTFLSDITKRTSSIHSLSEQVRPIMLVLAKIIYFN